MQMVTLHMVITKVDLTEQADNPLIILELVSDSLQNMKLFQDPELKRDINKFLTQHKTVQVTIQAR